MPESLIDRNQIKEIYKQRFSQPPSLSQNDAQLVYLKSALPNNKHSNILDAGCGDGRYSRYLVENGYQNVHAVDLFEELSIEGVQYQTASVDELPFKNDSFDLIFSNSVIFYVEPPVNALREFHRVLKPGGVVMITAHTKWSLFTLYRVLKRDWLKSSDMEHLAGVNFYSAAYYQRALEASNFWVSHRDGWRLSFILYPLYRVMAKVFKKIAGMELPAKLPRITRNKRWAELKSEISYHSVLIAKKK
jgi:SAM-dependent methyltransferase